jgi:GT2 family glycosyltransferase
MAQARAVGVARRVTAPEATPSRATERPRVGGKFFVRGGEKIYLRGVTYGPFAAGADGEPFPEPEQVRRDFLLMKELGANCVRTFTAPPRWLLDLAAEADLWVLAGLPWTQHTCFLDSEETVAANRRQVAEAVRRIRGHSATFAYLVGNEIPPDVVRWFGPERVARFLRDLAEVVREADPGALVSYANFPSTEYLDLEFVDFLCFNVYLHEERAFRRYLARLQSLADLKPLMLTEFGIDSIREGDVRQGEILAWQIRAAFEGGVAGTFVFSWTDEWYTGGADITDWAFGLVTRDRLPKPAFRATRALYDEPLPPPIANPPKVSVVICAFNAERTMEACCESLTKLRYAPLEIIVVDDGSTDRTAEIAARYPFRLIRQENKGLSVARNVGIEAATGEIVAYTDSDCVADPDWLTYLVGAMLRHDWVACGGPNLSPPEPSLVPACVAVAPGGPTHVLVHDDVAEHIPGCNMAFRKSALLAVGMFDPQYTSAGDDVDLCWRLQNQGWQIGFAPGAMVWHFRRNTVKAYLRQQRGYGKAEALLYFKHPYRFNLLGQSRWLGRIYGGSPSTFGTRRPIIYYGAFGRGLFQTLYEPPASLFSSLPFTLEWNAMAVILLLCGLFSGRYLAVATVPLLVSFTASLWLALQPTVDPRYDGLKGRALLALLIYLGPLGRAFERYRWRLRGLGNVEPIALDQPKQRPSGWLARSFQLAYWSERSAEKEALLSGLVEFLLPRKLFVDIDRGWNDWDLEIHRGAWAISRLTVAVENHGGEKRLLRVRCVQRTSPLGRRLLAGCALLVASAIALGVPDVVVGGAIAGASALGLGVYKNYRLGQILYHVVEIVASKAGLAPAGTRR